MKEKVLEGKKHGMAVLILWIAVTALAAILLIMAIMKGSADDPYLPLFLPAMIWIIGGWILLPGFRVLKPQEALVLTLFGKYVGTLKGEGFYYVNPFCTAVNPAAGTRLSQSADVNDADRRRERCGLRTRTVRIADANDADRGRER